jgi:transcription elongation factor Elf1
MDDFICPACGGPALVYPSVLEDNEPVTCANCGVDLRCTEMPL